MSEALIIIDAQNEFSAVGKRPVPNFSEAIDVIKTHVNRFRSKKSPIAWIRHFNQPHESPAFMPGTWGSEFYPGLGPANESSHEREFQKNVYGAFTGTELGKWLDDRHTKSVLIIGFYTHGCLSTTAREAIMRDLNVFLDPNATGACEMTNAILGKQSADEVRFSALLHLVSMGASIYDPVMK